MSDQFVYSMNLLIELKVIEFLLDFCFNHEFNIIIKLNLVVIYKII